MIDIQVVVIRDLLKISEVDFVPDMQPPSLDIRGEKFRQADEVTINGMPSPEYVIASDTRILAQIPESQRGGRIRELAVLAKQPSPDRRSQLHFDLGKRGLSTVSGLEKLVQQFVKILIQTPGTDIYSPELGGGLKSLVGELVSKDDSNALSGSVVSAVTRTKDQILRIQSRQRRLPPDEKLLRADVQGVGFNPNITALVARITISAVSGREAVTNLTL